jgi:WD40 repeat protein
LLPHDRLGRGGDRRPFTPDGRTLLLGGQDGLMHVVDPDTGVVRETLGGHNGTITGITVSPDGRTAWAAGRDGDLIALDLDGDRRLPTRSPSVVADAIISAATATGSGPAPRGGVPAPAEAVVAQDNR